ncbi:hypothetical protein [Shewanella surugensis]|nr:hypothetical protein [Shewanella surugensis]
MNKVQPVFSCHHSVLGRGDDLSLSGAVDEFDVSRHELLGMGAI